MNLSKKHYILDLNVISLSAILFLVCCQFIQSAQAADPNADAGNDTALVKNNLYETFTQLDGTASTDPEGDGLTYHWYGPFGKINGETPFIAIPEGNYTVSLTVSDCAHLSVDTVVITVSPCFYIYARCKPGKVQLTWTNIEGTERYDIYRSEESNPTNFLKIGETTSTYSTYLDEPVANETTYLYVVGALSQGSWCYSNVTGSHPTAIRGEFNYAPVIYSSPITHGYGGIIFSFDVNAIDPNSDSLIFSLDTAPYGMTIDASSGLIHWLPSETQVGENNVAVRVQDMAGLHDTQEFTVTVESRRVQPPTVSFSAFPDTVTIGQSSTLSWTFSNANCVTIEPGIGQVNANGSIRVSPDETTRYIMTATNPGGETHATVTITHVNSAPVADNQTWTTDEDGQIPITLTASDLDNDSMTYQVVTKPTRGILTGTAPNLTYTPHENQNGSDSFTFKANDGFEDSNIATVSITINPVNDSPVANGGPDQSLVRGATVFLDASGSNDLDGDALSYQWSFLSIPKGSAASFSDPSSETPSFVTDQAGAFELQLIVFDGTKYSSPDLVLITSETVMTEVPNLIGLTRQAAETALNNAGLTTGSISQAYSDTEPEGSVISQDPAAGTVLEIGTTVNAIVSLGPEFLVVTIKNPVDNQTFAQGAITVTGTVNRTGSAVSVNGIVAAVVENAFIAEGVTLTMGVNNITAEASEGTETAVDTITVFFAGTDIEPVQLNTSSFLEDPVSLRVSGDVLVTLRNNGSGDITNAYKIALFEDTDNSGTFDKDRDNLLGQASVDGGPSAGVTMDVSVASAGELLFRDNPLYVILDSEGQLQETDESNNQISNRPSGTDLSTSRLNLDSQYDCPSQVSLSVRLGNSGGLPVTAGVPIAFYDGNPDENGALIGVVTSTLLLEPGDYEDIPFNWTGPSTGERYIFCRADDNGAGTGALDETCEGNNTVSAQMNICTGPPPIGAGSISGTVMNAVKGVSLPNAKVVLHMDQNGEPGQVIAQNTTGEFGWFMFTDLGPGAYILVSSVDGYITGYLRVTLAADHGLADQNMALSPILGPEEIRIVLTWGLTPCDLEAHLTAPNPEGCRYHCFYWNRNIPGATLDRDDRDSYGPETITSSQRSSGIYRFYVHDFTNRMSFTSQALSQSNALVTVYFGSGADPVTFNSPQQAGTVWHVFDLDGSTGAITPINKMTFQDESGEIDFPRITSSPKTWANWGEPYFYQLQAEDPDLDALAYSLPTAPQGMTIDPSTGLIQWTPSGSQGGTYPVKVRVQDGRCGDDSQEFYIRVSYLPIVSFSVNPCGGINPGGDITLDWSVQRAETVTISPGIGEVGLSGTLTIPSREPPVGYILTASNGAGHSIHRAPNIPQVSLNAGPSLISAGGQATLTWTTQCATSCSISPDIGAVDFNGSITVAPQKTTTYTLTAVNGTGSNSISCDVNVYAPPLINFFGSNAVPSCSWMPGDPVILSWQCDISVDHCVISQGIGNVSPNGSLVVTPNESVINYTLEAFSNDGRTASKTITLCLSKPLAISNFTSDDYYIDPGQSVKLTWSTQCAIACTLDQGMGAVEPGGYVTVTPATLPITYTLTASNENESITKTLTISQNIIYPSATFSVDPVFIKVGESATLTWSTQNAVSCSITPDIGEVALNGSIDVNPGIETSYTLKAAGQNGFYVNEQVKVCYVAPSAQIQASPENIRPGESCTLSWIFSNANTCTVDNGIGAVSLNQTVVVTPSQTTTYTITADGPGGRVLDSVTLTVNWAPSVNMLMPSGDNDPSNGSFAIKWSDYDPDDNATISLYYDTDNTGQDGTMIVSGLKEDPDGAGNDEYAWDVSQMPDGIYYIYAVINDGKGTQVVDYSDGVVNVTRNPSLEVIQPDGANDYANSSFIIKWTDADMDDNGMISLYYDTDNSGADGILIASNLTEDPDEVSDTYEWNTAGIAAGQYYIYAVITDGKGVSVVDYSDGPVVIEHNIGNSFKLKADDAASLDNFGRAAAISGDYAIVGAPLDDVAGKSDSGSAYIYKREGAAWIKQAKLVAGDAAASDYFGCAVSISGDYAIVGAYQNDDGGSDSGSAYVFRRDGSMWVEEAKLTAGDAEAFDYFGYSVCISGDYAIMGAYLEDNDTYSDAGAAYIFKRVGETWVEQAKIKAGGWDGYFSDYFGCSISISGDYAIVGAYKAYGGRGTRVGAAYVFKNEGSTWVKQTTLTASDASTDDYFGYSVSISGDYAIVGAYSNDDAGSASGSAYIFRRNDSTWVEEAKLTAGDAASSDYFGYSVSISGNYAVVGAYRNDDNGADSGSAYVYTRGNELWAEHAKLTASDAAASDWFGYSVGLDRGFVIAGAYRDDDGGTDTGSAYIFPVLDVTLSASPKIIEIGESTTLEWDATISDFCTIEPTIGSVEGNGSLEVSPTETTTYNITATSLYGVVTDSVTVYVSDPINPPSITINAKPDTIAIGGSSTLSWDIANGTSCAIEPGIGNVAFESSLSVSPTETTTYTITASNSGHTVTENITVTVIYPPSINLTQPDGTCDLADNSFRIQWNDSDFNDNATISLFYDTENTGEDGTLIVTGVQEDPDGGVNDEYQWNTENLPEGLYYVYAVIDDGENAPAISYGPGAVKITHFIQDEIEQKAMDASAWDYLGYSVSIAGDYAIVGAEGDDDGDYDAGSAYIFHRDGTVWAEQTKLVASDIAGGDDFGTSVSISGDYAIVGASGDDDGGSLSGSAYIFKREGPIWVEQAKLTASDAAAGDLFGNSVSINGDYAIIGAYGNDDGGSSSGSAYIFIREGSVWLEQAKLTASDAAENDYFGYSVSIDGEVAVVGAHLNDDKGANSGSAYIFKREGSTWTEQGKLIPSDAAADDYLGYSVSINGDYLIIGAYRNDDGGSNSGSAYIFKRDGLIWAEQAKLTASDAAAGDYFGLSVSMNGDYAIVGAYADDDKGLSSGSAYLFKRDGLIWTQIKKITAGNGAASDYFGRSVSLTNNYAIVGAYGKDDSAVYDAGSVYFYPIFNVTLSADPGLIQAGEPSTLSWQSFLADSCSIEPEIGVVGTSGTMSVSPTQTTTYTITATGPSGSTTDKDTVYVVDPTLPPSVTINSDQTQIGPGNFITLTWNATNADTCLIEPGIGAVAPSGSIKIVPAMTTTYTITASNSAGTETALTTVTVIYPEPVATISASPLSINYGQSTLLYWNTTNATSCVIEPDIGTVNPNGSIMISPATTTTYSITATNPDGTATANVTVTVITVEPIVTLTASPASILYGQSSTLTWSSTNATSCVIEPAINEVSTSGSMSVSPTQTTIYTITATGPGGTATKTTTVTVTHTAPTVSISATPNSLNRGQKTILTWSSSNATSCIIEPDIGEVDTGGSVEVSPTQTTTYTITANGLGGSTTAQTTITVTEAIHLQITSPTQGETINKPFVMVKGTFSNDLGLETGITVNGQVAMTYGNEFVANQVPLEVGANTITVYATDVNGNTNEASIVVDASVAEKYLNLTADEYEGVSLLETKMTIEASFDIADISLSYIAPDTGLVEFFDTPSNTEFVIRTTGPGIYYFTAQATDNQNNVYEDTIGVVVWDAYSLDTLLKSKWNGMRSKLLNSDIDGALKYIAEGRSRERYRKIFNFIETNVPGGIAANATELPEPEFINFDGNIATYILARNEEEKIIEYMLYFLKDEYGIWRIENY
ncbi:exported hypothetical protein [uncultured Desulfobacterium sp.]|uniref:PASTA domain-containing protein n=1 Tax=uncultured Desulfobacterium sp. TaxID=201089 RepID=A0A445N0M2_9BACT|nr:exported hypothetical protein [uncultured Desulfobacterium sp.]